MTRYFGCDNIGIFSKLWAFPAPVKFLLNHMHVCRPGQVDGKSAYVGNKWVESRRLPDGTYPIERYKGDVVVCMTLVICGKPDPFFGLYLFGSP